MLNICYSWFIVNVHGSVISSSHPLDIHLEVFENMGDWPSRGTKYTKGNACNILTLFLMVILSILERA